MECSAYGVQVMVVELTDAVKAEVPEEIDGVKISFSVVGHIVPLGLGRIYKLPDGTCVEGPENCAGDCDAGVPIECPPFTPQGDIIECAPGYVWSDLADPPKCVPLICKPNWHVEGRFCVEDAAPASSGGTAKSSTGTGGVIAAVAITVVAVALFVGTIRG